MSLQVPDPRSRGRSKSREPSSSTGERLRSRSRDPRSRGTSSSRAAGERRHRSRSRYGDVSEREEDGYYPQESLSSSSRKHGSSSGRRRRRHRHHRDEGDPDRDPDRDWGDRGDGDRYYGSGEDDEIRRRVYGRYNKNSGSGKTAADEAEEAGASYYLEPPSKHDSEPEKESDSSVDDRLAYGPLPGTRKPRSRLKSWFSPSGSDSQVQSPASGAGTPRPPGESADGGQQAPGNNPGYARLEPFRYANPLQYVSPQFSRPAYPPTTTSASPSTWAPVPECEQPGFVPPSSQAGGSHVPGAFPPEGSSSLPAAPSYPMPQYMHPSQYPAPYGPQTGHPFSVPSYDPAAHATAHQRTSSGDTNVVPAYANPAPFQYAHIDPNIRYSSKNSSRPFSYPSAPGHHSRQSSSTSQSPAPGQGHAQHAPPKPPKLPARPELPKISTSQAGNSHDLRYVEITPGGRSRPPSHSASSGSNLAVAQPDPTLRPASPLQEPYKGTYQTISPMPSPIMAPAKSEDDVSDVELEGDKVRTHRRKKSRDDRGHRESRNDGRRERSRVRHERHSSSQSVEPGSVVLISPGVSQNKRVSFYNPTPDAIALQEALSQARHIDHKTLVRILPHLNSEDILDLRKEYKEHVKLHGKGINIAKHIRLKLGNSAFGKVCYATTLGRWESEAYWANCYYQSGSSRRELLIESLMGRRNSDIRAIKECFRDSRYVDSLERCMKTELKADKFRTAVLLALDERRQSEREPVDGRLIEQDVYELHRALVSRDGGETAMIFIIVRRSDSHLREVLRTYEKAYRHNFAKAMISKSPNLVVCFPLFFFPHYTIQKKKC